MKVAPLPIALLFAAPLWLAACGDERSAEAGTANEGPAANITVVDRPEAVANAAASPAPLDPSSEAAKGKPGARAVLDAWARALERRDWAAARSTWGHDGGDSGLDPDAFARSYDRYKTIRITYGDGDVEGGAGSLYYQVSVTFTGTLRDGRQVRMEGPVTLRRVNDVDGASPADLIWHLSMSDLKPRP